MSAAVTAGVDAQPVLEFEFCEDLLVFVALALEHGVMRDRHLSVDL